MRIGSFGRVSIIGTAAMLVLATSQYLPINVQAQRRAKRKPPVQKLTVALTEKGYEPTNLKLLRGVPAQVTFIRKVSATCGTQILIADYNIKRALPLNEPVLVEFTPKKTGTFAFTESQLFGKFNGVIVRLRRRKLNPAAQPGQPKRDLAH